MVPYKKSRPRRALLLIFFGLLIVMAQFLVNGLIVRLKDLKTQVFPAKSKTQHLPNKV
jgi:LPS O-antigen subunit length determinant protein (WzzB/FepE family)